jgi:hypothetical protein
MIAASLKLGAAVHVWPRPGRRVPTHAGIANRFLPPEGAVVEWSTWWARRVADGSALLTDPSKATTPASQPAPGEGGES